MLDMPIQSWQPSVKQQGALPGASLMGPQSAQRPPYPLLLANTRLTPTPPSDTHRDPLCVKGYVTKVRKASGGLQGFSGR